MVPMPSAIAYLAYIFGCGGLGMCLECGAGRFRGEKNRALPRNWGNLDQFADLPSRPPAFNMCLGERKFGAEMVKV